ncbi:hypothetical protein V6N11_021337 [Hibiscus sabdariffa]|uniref:Uncharacterized protein n=1 Tax=Hibiscus sabdariffa TaxID=183260 RepID=A0ABR2NMG9_9ROSI
MESAFLYKNGVQTAQAQCASGEGVADHRRPKMVKEFDLSGKKIRLWEPTSMAVIDEINGITTIVVLGVLYGISNTFGPLPEDIFRYGAACPCSVVRNLKGRFEYYAHEIQVGMIRLISIAALLAWWESRVFWQAPLLEETVFRGFFMTSLTKWGYFGIFICSNSQSGDSYYNPCFLELGSDFTSYLS